ncbi:DctP family TRAP transporter solute-binding subunit [Brevibacillus sp. TJ4]|uniref:DctP family TRAP transporter solute-binding subunit n=1 Tax=Brevibacillus sp. TJ4 TaxID=3234853 RepID=UPI0037CCF39C
MKKFVVFSVLTCMLALAGCSSSNSSNSTTGDSQPAPKTMKVAITVPKDRSYAKALYSFAEKVEAETAGSIKVQIFPDGQLGGDRDNYNGMKANTIQASLIAPAPIAADAPRFNALELPFLFKDAETAYKVLDGPVGKELLEDLPPTGVVGLSYWENGFRHLTNNVREVKSADDVAGLKIRTMESAIHLDLWKELGATPTPLAYTELFTALEQQVVDGQENPSGNVTTAKFYEVQKYLTKTGHVYNPMIFLVSKNFWDSLTDQEREIIAKVADEMKEVSRQLNQQEDQEAMEYLVQQGMTITELSPEEKDKFQEKVRPVYEKYAAELGEDLVNKLLEATK